MQGGKRRPGDGLPISKLTLGSPEAAWGEFEQKNDFVFACVKNWLRTIKRRDMLDTNALLWEKQA